MSVLARLAVVVVVLGVIFGGAVGIGSAVDTNRGRSGPGEDNHAMAAMQAGSRDLPPGLAIATGEFRLVTSSTTFAPGRSAPFSFRIVNGSGATVRDFDSEYTKRMHLIVVRRDLGYYQHVHPTEASDGTWRIPLLLDKPGAYRVFADFQPHSGHKTTLGADVFVSGDFNALALPGPSARAGTDGYDVVLDGAGHAGEETPLSFTVSRNGSPVKVEPYLGADGHLVALREGDLAYLHVHPQETPGSGGPIRFLIEYPSVGRYRLFLQFKDEGTVHTVAFTQQVS